ncbi:MAG: prolipoprotein diacylglyceryl transferase [Thermoleophilia bacterium]
MPYRTFEMITIGPLHLRTWGLMVGLGVLAGAYLTTRLARQRGLDPDRIWALALVAAAAGLLGSRVLWALQPSLIRDTIADPLTLVAVWRGGLTFIGGLLGGLTGGLLYLRRARLPILTTADLIAPGLGLGLAIGRIGCFLTGLHPGKPTTLPWGIDYLGAVRHPIPLYESVLGLALLGLGLALLRRRPAPGVTALAVGAAYLTIRALLDLLRADTSVRGADPRLLAGLTLTQGLALVLTPLMLGMLWRAVAARRA